MKQITGPQPQPFWFSKLVVGKSVSPPTPPESAFRCCWSCWPGNHSLRTTALNQVQQRQQPQELIRKADSQAPIHMYWIRSHFFWVLLMFLKISFWFRIVLGLQKSYEYSAKRSHISHTQFPLSLTSNVSIVCLSKLTSIDTLLTEVLTLFRFPQIVPNVLFLSWSPI